MDNMMNEYKELFLEEADEYITALNDSLIALEKDKNNSDLIDNIFRVAHTLKSSSAAVGYEDLSSLCHKAEDLMQQIRSGDREVSDLIVEILFNVFDIIREYVQCIKDGTKRNLDIDKMILKLEEITQNKKSSIDEIDESNNAAPQDLELIIELNEYEKQLIQEMTDKKNKCYLVKVQVDERETLKWLRAELLLNNIKKFVEVIKIFPEKEVFLKPGFSGFFGIIIISKVKKDKLSKKINIDLIKNIAVEEFDHDSIVPIEEDIKDEEEISLDNNNEIENEESQSENINEMTDKDSARNHQVATTGDTIRVPVKKLDNLMHLIGELVITNSGLKIIERQIADLYKDKAVYNSMNSVTDKLINISSELQNSIMKTRMLPISNILNQFNRIVRDLSKEEKKEIDLIIKGGDTELDKKVIDSMGDPLMHLIRNSIDHGIEHPADRIKNRKPPKGTIILSASQSGNHIVISIKDDGKGIDIDKVREKALSKKMFSKDVIDEMSDQQLLNLIFEPGFSTVEKISSVSGRGVGLDVVKTVINKLSGTIEINTDKGEGTEFLITLPLTLAITTVIIVQANDITYAIPIADIEESLNIKPEESSTIQGVHAITLRDEILPLVSLSNIFNKDSSRIGEIDVKDKSKLSIVVVSYREKKIGLIVDNIIGQQEIVLKPLEEHYQALVGLSGAAILGDGRIILVVDISGVTKLIKDINARLEEAGKSKASKIKKSPRKKEKKKSSPEDKIVLA